MTTVSLHSVTLERFQSFREKTTLVFKNASGLKFITGRNMVEPRLGANGAGKSTIFEAVTWGLFGATSDGDRASDVVTWGEKTPRVAVWVLIDGAPKRIVREGSPNRLTIDDETAEQADVDRLIGLSKSRFLQTVLFGQGAPLFFDLTVPERGALLDDVFAISYWGERSDHARKLELAAEVGVTELTNRAAVFGIALQTFNAERESELEAQAAGWEAARQRRIDAAITEVRFQEDRLAQLEGQGTAIRDSTAKLQPSNGIGELLDRQARAESERGMAQSELARTVELLALYRSADVCPTCKQLINAEFRQAERNRLEAEAATADHAIQRLDETCKLYRTQIDRDNRQRTTFDRLQSQLQQIETERKAANQIIAAIEANLEQETDNPHVEQLARFREERSKLQRNLSRLLLQRVNRQTHLEALQFWKQAFKRVRLFLLKQVLDSLTIEIAAAATALGLSGWQIALATETETKSGTVRPGVQITVTSPDKASRKRYSGGEHQRIKLAVSIGLANMIQRMAGVTFDFEIWDEPTQYLSEEGISDLLECLSYRAQSEKKSIYLLDHRSLNYGFDETIFIEKTQTGSRVRTE